MTRPFLLLAVRPEDVAADDEYAAMLRATGLGESGLRRVRVEQRPLEPLDLREWSGVLLGGGPFQASDPEGTKSPVQRRLEADLARVLDLVVPADFPFVGCCYGIGTLGRWCGGLVDRTHGEPVGATRVALTAAGRADALFTVAPDEFGAFVGHKEAITALPPAAVVLATSAASPVQAFRLGANVYATQFHPELDLDGLTLRVRTYQDAGYFPADEVDAVLAAASEAGVRDVPPLLRRFVELHSRD